ISASDLPAASASLMEPDTSGLRNDARSFGDMLPFTVMLSSITWQLSARRSLVGGLNLKSTQSQRLNAAPSERCRNRIGNRRLNSPWAVTPAQQTVSPWLALRCGKAFTRMETRQFCSVTDISLRIIGEQIEYLEARLFDHFVRNDCP